MKKFHYTYQLSVNQGTEKEIFYVGVRSCDSQPDLDINYLGSSRLVNHLILQGLVFTKKIISVHQTREDANNHEQQLLESLGCITRQNCLNLQSHKMLYNKDLAECKLSFLKKNYPELILDTQWRPTFRNINANDLKFCVGYGNSVLKFINHPDSLKYYYISTATKTFWPGRDDKLMSIKKSNKEYYKTDVHLVDGTPVEQIYELFENHYVSGQKVHIIELAIELFNLTSCNKDLYNFICSHLTPEHNWLKNKLDIAVKKMAKNKKTQ